MSAHEPNTGSSDEWYTPPEYFHSLNIVFDMDVASPPAPFWVPAKRVLIKKDDGLLMPWSGCVWMNPPFGNRLSHLPWLNKFILHSNGLGLARAYTSSEWFHIYMKHMDFICFPKGKTKFYDANFVQQRQPGHGIVLFSKGSKANKALIGSGLGIIINMRKTYT